MKLKLKNFRCYLEKEIDFGSDGVILLSGQSGVGKTTLLLAINFCLYGTGTKVTSFGKTGCSVQLETNDMTITRTKRPNRLVVEYDGKKYEDLEAQGIIDNLYGKCFETTCYLQQNALKSFILMSASDKLEFLEKFALNGIDLEKIKKRCYATIKARNEQLISTTSRLEMTEKHFQTLTEPKMCEFPAKCRPSQREKYIQNHQIKLKNNDILLRKTEKKISKITEKKNDFLLKISKKDHLERRRNDLKTKLKDLDERLAKNDFSEETLADLNKRLKIVIKQKERRTLKNSIGEARRRLVEIELQDLNERSSEIQILKSQLYQQGSREEVLESIDTLEKARKIVAVYESVIIRIKNHRVYAPSDKLEKELEQLRQSLEQVELYKCPNCKTSLKFLDKTLVVSDLELVEVQKGVQKDVQKNILESRIEELEKLLEKSKKSEELFSELVQQRNRLEEEYFDLGFEKIETLPSSDDLKEELKNLHEYLTEQTDMEKRIFTLEKGEKSSVVKKLEKELKTMEELYVAGQSVAPQLEKENDDSEELLRLEIAKSSEKKTLFDFLSFEQRQVSKELGVVENDFNQIQPMEDPTIELELENSKKIDLRNQRIKLEEISKKLGEFEVYSTALAEYKSWEQKVNLLREEEVLLRKLYSAATLLKEKILEAESIAIMNVVETINVYSQEYLDLFFPNDPIIVRLMPFKVAQKDKGKENAKSKPQITVEIDYKGNQCDLSSLSGGELARVVLAYTLALCEIFDAPLLMLDECTASLDQELAGVVMEGIRTRFREKLVVVIAHQCVTGDFDRHIQM